MRHAAMWLMMGGVLLGNLAGDLSRASGDGLPPSAEHQPLPYVKIGETSPWRRAEALLVAGQYSQARQYLHHLLSEDQGNPHLWYLLGKVMEQQGDLEGAQAAYQRTLAISPGYPELSRVLMAHSRGDALPIWDPRRQKKSLPSAVPAAQNPIAPQDGASRHAVAVGMVSSLATPIVPPAPVGTIPPGGRGTQIVQPMGPPAPVGPPAGVVQPWRGNPSAPGTVATPQSVQPIVPPPPGTSPAGVVQPWRGNPSAPGTVATPQSVQPIVPPPPGTSPAGVVQPWRGNPSGSSAPGGNASPKSPGTAPVSPDQPAHADGKP